MLAVVVQGVEMPDVSNKDVANSLELRSWDEFADSMKPLMDQFDEVLREHILMALYDRANFRGWMQDLRFKESKRAPVLRRERIRGDRMRGHIQNAIDALKKAKVTGTLVARETEYVREAEILLNRANDDLSFLEEVRIALVHPQRRNKTEKKRTVISAALEDWKVFPGFRKAKVDQMFIAWMESYLSVLITKRGRKLEPKETNELISATLQAAFHEGYTPEHVRSVRRLLAKKRLSSGKKP
jgi:hypothetical protein